MWQVYYEAPKGHRVNRYFWQVTVRGLWFEYASGTWKKEAKGDYSSHHKLPKTKKAFERYLKNHPELKGYEVILVNNFYIAEGGISLDLLANWVD
jgi:hypothetical protein